jgi:hypothetical protein
MEPHSPTNPWNKNVLNWIFLISALNFSFWSEHEGTPYRYGVEWQAGWDVSEREVWTGYWSLVAALNKGAVIPSCGYLFLLIDTTAMQDEELPIVDPAFYSSEILCPDAVIANVFREASQSKEGIPLLQHRVAIMREVGSILCNVCI